MINDTSLYRIHDEFFCLFIRVFLCLGNQLFVKLRNIDLDVVFQESSDLTGTTVADGSVSFYGAMLKEASQETLDALGLKKGVEIVSIGAGKVLDAGGTQGMAILSVNDEPVSKPEDVINIAKKAKRSVMVEGVTASGRVTRFVFGKD